MTGATVKIHIARAGGGQPVRAAEAEIPARDLAPSGLLAVTSERHKVYDVTHVPTGFRIPSGSREHRGGWRTKTEARAAMLALDGAGVELDFTLGTKKSREAIKAIRTATEGMEEWR